MKKHRKLYIIMSLIILMLASYMFFKKNIYQNSYDDILFFKIFQNPNEQEQIIKQTKKEQEGKQYIFKMNCKNTDFKNIDLIKTINRKTLVNEKIAPGIEGEFQIILEANEDTNYQIVFQSKNEKPKNLKFENVETKIQKDNLEDLNADLTGKINKNEKKTITIHWSWQYENTEKENQQDTLDSKNIQKYEFTIYANGQSVI